MTPVISRRLVNSGLAPTPTVKPYRTLLLPMIGCYSVSPIHWSMRWQSALDVYPAVPYHVLYNPFKHPSHLYASNLLPASSASSASSVSLMSSLAPELLDAILTYVPASSLPALALTSRAFADLVPRHAHSRTIRTKLSNARLWTWLARQDDLSAARVQSLTILPDNPADLDKAYAADFPLDERVPPGFLCAGGTNDGEAEEMLICALRRMTSLTQFRWLRVPQPCREGPGDLWDTLNRLGTVERLHVLDQSVESVAVREEVTATARSIVRTDSFLRIRGLKSLKIRTSTYTGEKDGAMLRKMLVPTPRGTAQD
ncbi:hypothetical protein NEOLEDRAFT_344860 [Neolentinus lepideus HHB14362 ss-1]|uniref:F-box domain-containing protein n=1 Tax=Neolentinus lepideus HHB14362 ss-1 TaxID=1314782 RepID=A0A165SPN2_9AGAM|nr:hypothetical protein NEOLEDRAFT_344860 [Neolentinus lepideus HHB14362 ss-1]